MSNERQKCEPIGIKTVTLICPVLNSKTQKFVTGFSSDSSNNRVDQLELEQSALSIP